MNTSRHPLLYDLFLLLTFYHFSEDAHLVQVKMPIAYMYNEEAENVERK